MSMPAPRLTSNFGYSATVRIDLHADGRSFSPSQTASDYLLFRQPQRIPSCEARLTIWIDGVPQRSTLQILPHESPTTKVPVQIIACDLDITLLENL